METNFNFKSQICTTREQSERLIALGLKKETADMCWWDGEEDADGEVWHCYTDPPIYSDEQIPAWSLHRMIEIVCNGQTLKGDICSDIVFDEIIDCIEHEIKEGYFNEEYLNKEE